MAFRLQDVRGRMSGPARQDYGVIGPEPGTSAFGEQARARREDIFNRANRGADLRVKTAYRTAAGARQVKNRFLMGD